MKILVVDDDPATLLVVTIALEESAGFQVIVARNGQEAIDLAKRECPDVILMDLVMPDLDGPEVLKKLRADDKTRMIPVIFHTAKTDPLEVKPLFGLGAKGIIAKPFNPLRLARQIEGILKS